MVDRMVSRSLGGVSFLQIDSDAADLACGLAAEKIQLHLPAPARRKLFEGQETRLEDLAGAVRLQADEISRCFAWADLVVILAGLGGITGSAGAPVVAQLAAQAGSLTLGVAVTPFEFEGQRRNKAAQAALPEFDRSVDLLAELACQELIRWIDPHISLAEAFLLVDDRSFLMLEAMTDLLFKPNLIYFGFTDLEAVFKMGRRAFLAVGRDDGPDRGRLAVRKALDYLDRPSIVKNTRGALVNITAGQDFDLSEANGALHEILRFLQPETVLVYGVNIDPSLKRDVRITLILVQ
jgi:cell division protein FtsZ